MSAECTAGCRQLSVFSNKVQQQQQQQPDVTVIVTKELINRTFVVPNSLLTDYQIEAGGKYDSNSTDWHNVSNLTSAAPLPLRILQVFI
jgi:hypothetical protein